MVLTLTSSPSLSLPLQTGLSSPEKTTLSAALTQRASKRVPKAVSYSWMFLFNILFVWFEIDLSPSHLDTGKQTSNWSTSIMWFWISPRFVVSFRKKAQGPLWHWWKRRKSFRTCGGRTDKTVYLEMLLKSCDRMRLRVTAAAAAAMFILLYMPFCQQVARSTERPTD